MGTTENEVIRQYLDSHWREIADYIGSRQKDASEVELVAYDPDRIVGLLCNFVWQGVRKVVRVTPSSLLEGLSQLNDDLRQRCIDAAAEAERQSSFAVAQGDYAKGQGDRAAALISSINELRAALDASEDGRMAAETIRQQKESERQSAEQSRERQEGARQSAFERDQLSRAQTFNESQTQRQADFEYAQQLRQETFEAGEAERMRNCLLTHFYIHPDTMELHSVQVQGDDMQYRITDDGELMARFVIDV